MLSPLAARRIRACLGALWLLDAALQAQPRFFTPDWWHNDLAESVMGQPQLVSHSILWATGHLAAHPAIANTAAIAIQATLGLCLLLGRFERGAISASIPWALGAWWIGEGFGALPTGFATLAGGAPGAVLLYPSIGLLCWPRRTPPAAETGRVPGASLALYTWAALWVGGAIAGLPWRFPAATMLAANIEQNTLGQPHWLGAIAHRSYGALSAHPLLVPTVLFVAQAAVGVAVLANSSRPYALAAGIMLALLFWVAGQSLGGLAGGAATDPGSGPLVVLLAAVVACSTHVQTLRRTEYGAWSSTSTTTSGAPIVSASAT